jgi:hypothetical protein
MEKKWFLGMEIHKRTEEEKKKRVKFKPKNLNREILPNENTFSFYKIMDYMDCNDFLWPIEIFGFN